MIIFDFSVALNANVHIIDKLGEPINLRNLRIRLLDHIIHITKKFKYEYGDNIVFALDASSWRKREFEYYKFKRRKKRKEDKHDWIEIYKFFDTIIDELKENFPYKLIKLNGCEGDDIIAVLSKEAAKTEKVLVISRDKDFMQLMDEENVLQYDPIIKEFIEADENIKKTLFTHIMKGDASDGIPNVYSESNFYTKENPPRQQSISKKDVERLILLNESELEKELGENVFKRFKENEKLIKLSLIPDDIKCLILDAYNNYKTSENNVYKYLIEQDLTDEFLTDINNF